MSVWAHYHPDHKVLRARFAPLLKEAWQKSTTECNAYSLFETCSIYPCNAEKIPEEDSSISDAVLSASVIEIMGKTSTKAQTVFLAQELNQETNLKQGHLLRTMALSLFWIHYSSGGNKQLQCSQTRNI
jgi:hypothetical protein